MQTAADNNTSGRVNGAIVSVVLHAALIALLLFYTLKPSENEPEIVPEKDFIAVELAQPKKIKIPVGGDVVKPKIDKPGKPIEQAPPKVKVAEKTRAPRANNKPDTKPVTAGNKGDVERYEKPKPKINENSLFKSSTNGKEEGHERSKIKDNSLFTGSGTSDNPTRSKNAASGSSVAEKGVSFSLSGRSVSGGFPKPSYNLQKSGKVVVEITVNQDGVVTFARATGKGSTVQDATLWAAAVNAAKRTRFNVDKNAAKTQAGTITYIFTLQ